jgi:hypothetical protein
VDVSGHSVEITQEANMHAQTIGALIGVVGGVVVAASACLVVLARVGARWRDAREEWAPDEVGSIDE